MTGNNFKQIVESFDDLQTFWANQLGVSQPQVSYLMRRGDQDIPEAHAAKIELIAARLRGQSVAQQTAELTRQIGHIDTQIQLIDDLLTCLAGNREQMPLKQALLTYSRELTAQRCRVAAQLAALREETNDGKQEK